MGAEASTPQGGDGKGSLVTEIMKLKAAKASGWLTEEEFLVEVKRVVQEFNGESREPAYDFEQTVMDTLSDEAQMAQWEARYGSEAATVQPQETVADRPAPLATENGAVELSLTGGMLSPKQKTDLEKELEEMGAQVEDFSLSAGGGAGDTGGESGEGGGEAGGEGENSDAVQTPLSPTVPTKLAPPSDDIIDDSPARQPSE